MKILALTLLLIPGFTQAESFRLPEPLLHVSPESAVKGGRKPASIKDPAPTNEEVFRTLKPGARALTRNSYGSWDDEVVTVVEIFDDNSVRVKFKDGRTPIVKFKNFSKNLSPVKQCGHSHGIEICKGDMVLYPLSSASLMIPEAKVEEVFANNRALLQDGVDFKLDLEQVGKSVPCSPQKESICVGDPVLAEGYKDGSRYTFEGKIEKAYSHGPVMVRVSPTLLIPIDVGAVKERVAGIEVNDPSVISDRAVHGKGSWSVMPEQPVQGTVLEELEALQSDKADAVRDVR